METMFDWEGLVKKSQERQQGLVNIALKILDDTPDLPKTTKNTELINQLKQKLEEL